MSLRDKVVIPAIGGIIFEYYCKLEQGDKCAYRRFLVFVVKFVILLNFEPVVMMRK